jgi:hypothetical protein
VLEEEEGGGGQWADMSLSVDEAGFGEDNVESDEYEDDFDLQDPRTVLDLEKENIHLKE